MSPWLSLDAIHSSPASSLPSRWSCWPAPLRSRSIRVVQLCRPPRGRGQSVALLATHLAGPRAWSVRSSRARFSRRGPAARQAVVSFLWPCARALLARCPSRRCPSGVLPFWRAWLPSARLVSRMRRPSAASAARYRPARRCPVASMTHVGIICAALSCALVIHCMVYLK